MWLLVGLGNPGERYHGTRHNLGWEALEQIIRAWGLSSGTNRFRGRFGDGRIHDQRLLWLMPESYMNLSGGPVAEAVRFYKLPPTRVVVLHDDMDLALGRVRIKQGGGHAGHNGLKSIQEFLGTADFIRVRLGVGRPPANWDPANYLLAPFSAEERLFLAPILEALPATIPWIMAGNFAKAMNHMGQHIVSLPLE